MAKSIRKRRKADDASPPSGPRPEDMPLPDTLLLLPVSNLVLFPHMVAPIALSEESANHLKASGTGEGSSVAVVTSRPEPEENPADSPTEAAFRRVYHIGTAASIFKLIRGNDGSMRVLLHGFRRIRLNGVKQVEPYPVVMCEALPEQAEASEEMEGLRMVTLRTLADVVRLAGLPEEFLRTAEEVHMPGRLADLIASNVNLNPELQQQLLEIGHEGERLRRLFAMLEHHRKVLEVGNRIQTEVRTEIEQNQRDFFLREQIRQIRRELGDDVDVPDELDDLREQVRQKNLPKHALEAVNREVSRLARITSASSEYSVARTYIDWILSLPWNELSESHSDLVRARKVLDEDHYDLVEVKDRILEYLAVLQLTNSLRGPILCFVGPPGVGKTSLGRSIARATGREFYRFSLGGMHDEAEIRGHRRTYIGALPGRIIKAYRLAGKRNPVIMLDEIDKLGSDFRGDPASALLEVLDPEQNHSFVDNYLDIPFDLSQTLFITTANMLETIPGPLRDRMEIIRLSGYTTLEKLSIAERYIVPRQQKENGLKPRQISLPQATLRAIIERYTREAGLREMERQVGRICRKVARQIAEGQCKSATITTKNLHKYLGAEKYLEESSERTGEPGVVTGLAWTQVGGEILYIEVNSSPGKGELRLTGQLGDVMKESAQAALSYLRSNHASLGIDPRRLTEYDYHVHIPAGAIPKDGPSAGISIATALASEMLGKAVQRRLAMTGEITLKGRVLPIGGVKEKVLAALRACIKEVILPRQNEKDHEEIPEEVRGALNLHYVSHIHEVLTEALGISVSTANPDRRTGGRARGAKATVKKTKSITVPAPVPVVDAPAHQ